LTFWNPDRLEWLEIGWISALLVAARQGARTRRMCAIRAGCQLLNSVWPASTRYANVVTGIAAVTREGRLAGKVWARKENDGAPHVGFGSQVQAVARSPIASPHAR
jgi:hypothetical protein